MLTTVDTRARAGVFDLGPVHYRFPSKVVTFPALPIDPSSPPKGGVDIFALSAQSLEPSFESLRWVSEPYLREHGQLSLGGLHGLWNQRVDPNDPC